MFDTHKSLHVFALVLFVILLTLVFEGAAFAQTSLITNGVNYLKTTQNTDGSWGTTATSLNGVFPTTIVALDALRAIEPNVSANQTSAIAYLSAQELEVTPFIAARVIALAGTGLSVTADVDVLIARQNDDGGWGTSEGLESDTLDTSLGLLALKAANVNAQSTLSRGLNYLAQTQNSDGGWSLTPGEESQVFYTSYALQALNSFRLQFGASVFQTRALIYLRINQSVIDGGSGNPISTPFETALSVLAIFGAGQRLTSAEARAISFLNSAQQPNGSWADDPYSTALVLRALSFPQDTDADGMSDECETANGLNPNDPADAARDNDGDGLPNLEECRRRCLNPNNPDTDGDTLNDGDELANGSDPCDAASRNRAPTITSQPLTTAREGEVYSYQVQASDIDNDPLTYTLLRSPAGMSISATGLIEWSPASNQIGRFVVVIKVSDGRGGSGIQQYYVAVLSLGVDLAIAAVDIRAMNTNLQSLVVTGNVRVEIQNLGGSTFAGSFEVMLFEDRNSNGTFDNGADVQLGAGTFSGNIDSAASASLDVPVSGVVLFHDNLVFAFVDSTQQIPELNETNNTGSSGDASSYQPPIGVFQPKVKWQYASTQAGVYSTPAVSPLIDTNGDGLINERDIPAVIVVDYDFSGLPARLVALRGDTGAIIFSTAAPLSANRAPAVGDIDGDGIPEIVVPADDGRVRCFKNDGTLHWTSPAIIHNGSITLADLDGDSKSEILSGSGLVNHNGTLRWDNFSRLPGYLGGVSESRGRQVADLDLDGVPEIISGPSALDRDGNAIWYWGSFFNGDGTWTTTGTLDRGATTMSIITNFNLGDSYTAIANLDDDPFPEVIVINDSNGFGSGDMLIFGHNGRIKSGPIRLYQQIPNQLSFTLGPPTVADFDGDGQPDIAVPAKRKPNANTQADPHRAMMAVYGRDGSLMWRRDLITSTQPSNGIYPVSAFDFDGDGAAELVYQDTQRLYVLKGSDGSSLFETAINRSQDGEAVRYPVVADVDNDGGADIVVPTSQSFIISGPARKGVLVLSDTKDNWLNARRVWNQWIYHVTNVYEDGRIPLVAANNWQGLNTQRAQSSIDGLDRFAAPDLTVSKVTTTAQNCPASLGVTARIGNGGGLHSPAGVTVNFYSGDPDTGGMLLGTKQTTRALYPGDFEDVTLTGIAPPSAPVFVTVNVFAEVSATPSANLSLLPHSWAQSSGFNTGTVPVNVFSHLGIDGTSSLWSENFVGGTVSTGPSFYEVRFPLPVNVTSVTVENFGTNDSGFLAGTLTFSNGFSIPATLNANGEGVTLFTDQPQLDVTWVRLTASSISSIRSGGASLSEFIVAGSFKEPQFRLNEGTGRSSNNKASSGVATCDTSVNQPPTIISAPVINADTGSTYSYQAQAVDPNNDPLTFSLVTGPTGMTISTTGLISWSPTEAQAGNTSVTVQVSDNRNGSATQSFIISVTGPGGNHAPQFTSTPPAAIAQGQTLQHDVTATDADGDEVIFTLHQAPAGATLDQFSGRLLWTPTAIHTGTQFFAIVAEDVRGGRTIQSFAVELRANVNIDPPQDQDGDGYLIPQDCDDTNPLVHPGRPEIPGNGIDDDCNLETPDALPPNALTCSLVTDKRSYDSNSLAQLTASVRNTSASATAAGLQAHVIVTDAATQDVFDSTLQLNSLAPQAASRSVVAFNTQARTPGQYQAALALRYGSNTVCQAQATFSILSSATEGTALTGTITPTPAIVNRGETATFAYQVTNVGNVDLAGLNLNLLLVSVSDGNIAHTFTEQTTLNRGQAFNTSRSLNTSAMNTGEYLLVLRGEIGGASQTVASAPLRVNASSFLFSAATYGVAENNGVVEVTVQRTGDTSTPATIDYQTSDDQASERRDHTTSLGTLRFAAGELARTFDVLVNDDSFAEASESVNLSLSNPVGAAGLGTQSTATLTLTDSGRTGVNPLDHDSAFFVRQHYHDFLNREPDAAGFQFWTDQLTQCGADAQCLEIKRINVSAAFFLSIEFQETGYLVHRMYLAAYGRLPRYREFLHDSQEIARGVVVGQGDWQRQLEENKQAFVNTFVTRAVFMLPYPETMTAAQFVDALNLNTESSLTQAERDQLVAELTSGVKTRAQVLRAVAENSAFNRREFSRAFVYMQYVGYLRRNPDDAPDNNLDGLNFWLTKLNQFNGNFIQAEMVKSFLVSGEYRSRFGQP